MYLIIKIKTKYKFFDIQPKKMALITRTCLYNVDPLEPHFYIVKLGFTGVYIIFLFLLKNIDCGYSLEPPRQGSSNEYPQSMFWAEIWKISEFLSENFHLVVKFSIYLNRLVFVMYAKVFSAQSDQGFDCNILQYPVILYVGSEDLITLLLA